MIKAVLKAKTHQSRFFSLVGVPTKLKVYSVKPDRAYRLYPAADRQTEFQSRPCRSIDHTDCSTHQAAKEVIHGYAVRIRLSHYRAVNPGREGYTCAEALSHPKKVKRGEERKNKRWLSYHRVFQSTNKFRDT